MEGQLQTAMKAVGQAIRLDDEGMDREAYYRYLACTQFISQGILEDSKNQGYQAPIKTKSSVRMLRLAQQCIDRAVAIMESTEEQTLSQLAPPPAGQSGRFSPSIQASLPAAPPNLLEPARPAPHQPPMPPPVRQASAPCQSSAALPVPVGYARPKTGRKDKLTPLEAAYVENQRLMNSYRARLAQLTEKRKGKGHLNNQISLNLTLQRRLMENLAIARAREAALAKKIQERHSRLQEEAVSRFSTTGEPTRAEIELRQIYANVMEFENNEDWLTEWRRKLHESPRDLPFIHALIGHILACADHPFTQLLHKFQYAVYQSLLPLVQKDAELLEQIKVPYKTVEPLPLSDAKARVIPPDGFSTPESPQGEKPDEDLLRRLQALRNSTSEERLESLYGNMLASSPPTSTPTSAAGPDHGLHQSSPFHEEHPDEMWDEDEDEDEDEAATGGADTGHDQRVVEEGTTVSAEAATSDSEAAPPPRAGPSLEVQLPEMGESDEDAGSLEGSSRGDKVEEGDAKEADPHRPRLPEVPVGASGDDGGARAEATIGDLGDAEGSGEESGGEDSGDVIGRMRRLTDEVREDLGQAAMEGTTRAEELVRETEADLALVEAGDEPTAEAGDSADRPDTEAEEEEEEEKEEEESREEEEVVAPEEGEAQEPARDQEEERTKEEAEQERIARLQEEALQRHLKHISKDIQSYLDRLQSLLVAIYEDLDSAVAKEQCIAIIEKHFFRLIWQPLLTLFRRANLRKEISAATAMTKYQNALPENIGIIKKLCLTSDEGEDSRYPYQLAVEELRRISGYFSPLEKLECVVKASRAIISCVGDYYEAHGESRENTENAVGCDDLLPILSFVVIKTALPHIVSECSIMEEFIHEGYLFGEEGYCLTTLQTSLGYVLKLAED